MNQNQRIDALQRWGNQVSLKDWTPYYGQVLKSNPWFTPENIELALSGIQRYLDHRKLKSWCKKYPVNIRRPKSVGVIMAGNLPLVGFHDLICVFASGHRVLLKLSSQDRVLLPVLLSELFSIDPCIKSLIKLVPALERFDIDAIIATGSDNTSRYIRYAYSNIPGIFRGNRSSVAIIKGEETSQQLSALGNDVFSYFGKGCRNVSKFLVPVRYDFDNFLFSNRSHSTLTDHRKYFNNYRYQRSLLRTSGVDHLDGGYFLITRNDSIQSPLSVINFETYQNLDHLEDLIKRNRSKIQCVASAGKWFPGSYEFGALQKPDLWDYSDNVDTMEFLLDL